MTSTPHLPVGITGTTRVAALVGSPVGHSLSPVIHNAAFRAAGADWVYVALDVAPDRGDGAVGAMRTLGLAGMSVTMPHKQIVAASVDALHPVAAALGAVNTVVVDGDQLVGHSTDGAGFVAALAATGVELTGAHIAVVGARGAGRAVIEAVGRSGAAMVTVINRGRDAAEQAIGLAPGVARIGELAAIEDADVVVNATSVGMGTDELPFPPDLIHSAHLVVDLVYHPLRTALLRIAAERGARTVDGLGMLVHQAALQHELWIGKPIDVAVMRAAAEAHLDGATEP